MYMPEHFKETDASRIAALLRDYPFAQLITLRDGVPQVSHLPLLYSVDDAGQAWLHGHLARANPQWQDLDAGGEALAVFNGPHAYISPRWYEKPGVPTWNYAVAHLRGRAALVAEREALAGLVERMSEVFEAAAGEAAWRWRDYAERFDGLLDHIVGFAIRIDAVEAKFKLGQNRAAVDQRNLFDRLSASTHPDERALAALMPGVGDVSDNA